MFNYLIIPRSHFALNDLVKIANILRKHLLSIGKGLFAIATAPRRICSYQDHVHLIIRIVLTGSYAHEAFGLINYHLIEVSSYNLIVDYNPTNIFASARLV